MLATILKYFPTENYDLCLKDKGRGRFGKHFIAEIKSNTSYDECLSLVGGIVLAIKMTTIHSVISNYRGDDAFDILQLIAESHISIHRLGNKMTVDVFSCKNFDEREVMSLLGGAIDDNLVVERGVQYK